MILEKMVSCIDRSLIVDCRLLIGFTQHSTFNMLLINNHQRSCSTSSSKPSCLGLKNLRLHKLRSLLTALGIIFGVAAVIIMVAIGEGTKQAALEQLQQLGAQNILLRSITAAGEHRGVAAGHSAMLDYGIKRARPGSAEGRFPSCRHDRSAAQHRAAASSTATCASTPTRSAPRRRSSTSINLHLAAGSFFDRLQYDARSPVCVLGVDGRAAAVPVPGSDRPDAFRSAPAASSAVVLLTVIGVLEPTGLRPAPKARHDAAATSTRTSISRSSLAQATSATRSCAGRPAIVERKQIELTEIWLQVRATSKTSSDIAVDRRRTS